MKKNIIILVCLIFIITGILLKVQSIDNNYYSLSEILNVDLDEIYIKGRNPEYDKQLNYMYGEHSSSLKRSTGSTVQTKYIYYDSEGNEKFYLLFLGNQNQVYVNDEKYIYSEDEINSTYATHELYPDPSKNDAEKFAYDIIKLFEEDDEYLWEDDFNIWSTHYYSTFHYELSNFINGIYFKNQGIDMYILEYDDDSIEDDYTKLKSRFKSSKYIVAKYNNLLIIVYEYPDQNSTTYDESNENISIIENYLTEQNIMN